MGLLRLGEKRGLASLDEAIETVAKIRARAQRDYPQQVFEAPARHEAPDMAEPNLAPAEPNIQMAASGTASVISPASLMEEFKNERPILMGVLDQASVRIKGEAVVIVVSDLHSREVLEEKEMKTLLEDISRKRISPAARVVVEYRSEKKNDDQVQANRSEDRKESIRKQMLESPIMEEAMDVFHLEEKGFKLLRRT